MQVEIPSDSLAPLRAAMASQSTMPMTPEKKRLASEVQDLQAHLALVENHANRAFIAQSDDLQERAELALNYQKNQFEDAAQRYKNEAREIRDVAVAQSVAEERGRSQFSLQNASKQLRNEAQVVSTIKQRAAAAENQAENIILEERRRAEHIVASRQDQIVAEARQVIHETQHQSSINQGDLLQEVAALRQQLQASEVAQAEAQDHFDRERQRLQLIAQEFPKTTK